MRYAVVIVGLILMSGQIVDAQSSAMSSSTSKGPQRLSLAEANNIALSGFEETFTMAAKAMPADKYDFTPASLAIPGANFQGVRSFSTEVKHVAQSNFITYQAISGLTADYNVEGIASLRTKSDILAALAASFAFGHKALVTLTPATEEDSMDFQGLKTKETVAAFALAHAFDHYGQMIEYLRMNGIVPPASATQPK